MAYIVYQQIVTNVESSVRNAVTSTSVLIFFACKFTVHEFHFLIPLPHSFLWQLGKYRSPFATNPPAPSDTFDCRRSGKRRYQKRGAAGTSPLGWAQIKNLSGNNYSVGLGTDVLPVRLMARREVIGLIARKRPTFYVQKLFEPPPTLRICEYGDSAFVICFPIEVVSLSSNTFLFFFSDISEGNNDYSDTLDFRSGGGHVFRFGGHRLQIHDVNPPEAIPLADRPVHFFLRRPGSPVATPRSHRSGFFKFFFKVAFDQDGQWPYHSLSDRVFLKIF